MLVYHPWTDLYHDLVHYFKYASSAYILVCPRPNGNSLVMQVDPLRWHECCYLWLTKLCLKYSFQILLQISKDLWFVTTIAKRLSWFCEEGGLIWSKIYSGLSQSLYLTRDLICSLSMTDFLMDTQVTLVPFVCPGVKLPCKCVLMWRGRGSLP